MSDVEYLKCPCKECGNNIEFPLSAKGTTVACPHCSQWTELLVPEPPREKKSFNFGLIPQVGIFVLLLLVIAGAIAYKSHSMRVSKESAINKPPTATKVTKVPAVTTVARKKTAPALTPTTNRIISPTDQTNTPAKPTTPRAKSPDDLKVGEIQLEKTKGSSLVYAVGTVKNDSDYDRYGIRIELDAFNKKGAKVAEAKDYKDYLAPHKDWQFHALIPDSKAATARVASVKEDQ